MLLPHSLLFALYYLVLFGMYYHFWNSFKLRFSKNSFKFLYLSVQLVFIFGYIIFDVYPFDLIFALFFALLISFNNLKFSE